MLKLKHKKYLRYNNSETSNYCQVKKLLLLLFNLIY